MLEETRIRGSLTFTKPVTAITEADLKDWLIDWNRSLRTKANHHGLIYGVFGYAVKRGWLSANPAVGTAPRMSRVKQSRPEGSGISEPGLRRWMAQDDVDAGRKEGLSTKEREEFAQLRRDDRRQEVEIEIEILKRGYCTSPGRT